MKLGLMSAALGGLSFADLATWAAEAGFEMLEVACWPQAKADRRYAGVTHIDVASLNETDIREIRAILQLNGLSISSLGYYPNPMHPDPEHRLAVIEHLKRVIEAAARLEVALVGTFVGRNQFETLQANLEAFPTIWAPIVRFAEERGVRIAIENCPMLFSKDEWPGGQNLAVSPSVWRRMFEAVPSEHFGLNLDPSHLLWQMIDIERVVREFSSRIFHVHAKDMEIDRNGLYEHGVLSLGMGWQVPRLPGLGEVNWQRFISSLYAVGYDFVVSVEHEDRRFEGSLELVQRGFLIARDALRPYLH